MTRYDRLADHFFESIKGGLVLQYIGPYRWKVEGLPQTPDTLEWQRITEHLSARRLRKQSAKPKRR
jgi:hypothetical protein